MLVTPLSPMPFFTAYAVTVVSPRVKTLNGDVYSWEAAVGVDPTLMLTGPIPATRKVLEKSGLKLESIDLFEVNEAFASVVLRFLKDTGADWDKCNVNGGAMALGHPIGATGGMLIGTMVDELERRDLSTGLITMCTGGGMATATIIERM